MRWVFWAAVALIAYTYAGYPVWLWLRSRWRPRPVQRGTIQPRVSVVMVVRNEERVLRSKLENLLALDYPQELTDLVVVSDGSTDGTEGILHEYARNPRVQTVLNQLSEGKASGLNDALDWVQGDIVIFTDARQKIETVAVRALLENFGDPEVGCVSGELMLGDPDAGEQSQGMGLYWRIEKRVRELESASGSVVGATGALYGVRRELLGRIPPETLLDDVYIPMQVVHQGKRVIFETQARAWDRADQGAGREFARKVRTLSGNYQLLQLAPWLLGGGNPIRMEFVSHKLLRLVVPFALLACLSSCVFLPGPFYRGVLALQVVFYALSLVGMARMKTGLFSRLGDAAYTFVVLNLAALVAFANFVTKRRVAWSR
ncbi:MAG TPA: glycosyltransferase family 2 protein [Terriglobales bacterium]|jgi:biofilm PGA synthesis N-glycosyltransferase PgaC|nr:glycosyltransferase family 2 protein [Terriglobales bacterium]